ncbi:hypothetical protein CO2235_MP40140 [Cupriavidus oxalaticus]|uniref:Uncharacterized protein n=1 Tax=Cupriavidus oxalaticus TaxID=96344 RepID=A0A976BIF1_9BURK|nr:hypothetical protein CO2235_MP40140 [Cupriavidus oxalaticus]
MPQMWPKSIFCRDIYTVEMQVVGF